MNSRETDRARAESNEDKVGKFRDTNFRNIAWSSSSQKSKGIPFIPNNTLHCKIGKMSENDNGKTISSKAEVLYTKAIQSGKLEILSKTELSQKDMNGLLHVTLKEKQFAITGHLITLGADPKSVQPASPGGQSQNIIFALLQDAGDEEKIAPGGATGTVEEFLDLIFFSDKPILNVKDEDIFGQTIQTMRCCQASDKIKSYFLEKSWNLVTTTTDEHSENVKDDDIPPLIKSLKKMPRNIDEILRRFDDSITHELDNRIHTNESRVIQDFKSLLPTRHDSSENDEGKNKKETEFLHSLLECNEYVRDKLIGHPLVQSFVYLKAKRFKKFVWLSVIFYLLFACFISLFVINVHLTKCKHIYKRNFDLIVQEKAREILAGAEEILGVRNANLNQSDLVRDLSNALHTEIDKPKPRAHKPKKEKLIDNFKILLSTPELEPSASVYQNRHMKCGIGTQTKITQMVGIGMIVALSLKVLTKIIILAKVKKYKVWKEYFLPRNWKNWMDIFLITTASLSFTAPSMMTSSTGTYIQFQAAACVVLITWSLLLVQLGKFQTLSVYIELFWKILETFVDFLFTFGVLFIGFTLSSTVLFSNNSSFYTLPRSLLKVFAMATGELGYEDFFYKDVKDNEILRYPFLSHLFFILFIVLVTLCLMNFLVALAVDGLEAAKSEAKIRSLTKTITYITHLEEIFCSDVFLFSWLTYWIRDSILLTPILRKRNNGGATNHNGCGSCTKVHIESDDSDQASISSCTTHKIDNIDSSFVYFSYNQYQGKSYTGFFQYVREVMSIWFGLDYPPQNEKIPQEIKNAIEELLSEKCKCCRDPSLLIAQQEDRVNLSV